MKTKVTKQDKPNTSMILPNVRTVVIYAEDLTCPIDEFTDSLRKVRASFSKHLLKSDGYYISLSLVKRPLRREMGLVSFEQQLEKVIQKNVKGFSRIVWFD